MPVLGLYLLTLPVGYALVSPLYPEESLTWRDFSVMALLIAIWPLVFVTILVEGNRRS